MSINLNYENVEERGQEKIEEIYDKLCHYRKVLLEEYKNLKKNPEIKKRSVHLLYYCRECDTVMKKMCKSAHNKTQKHYENMENPIKDPKNKPKINIKIEKSNIKEMTEEESLVLYVEIQYYRSLLSEKYEYVRGEKSASRRHHKTRHYCEVCEREMTSHARYDHIKSEKHKDMLKEKGKEGLSEREQIEMIKKMLEY